MKIEVKAKLILTVPDPKKEEFAGAADIVLAAEQFINNAHNAQVVFSMPETGTQVGVRIYTLGIQKVTK